MEGLLLRLTGDTRAPGSTFWLCFEPLRAEFDRHFWVFTNQPWMAAPLDFDEDSQLAGYEREGHITSVQLWCSGSIGRWATHFSEEYIELWAIGQADDPLKAAAAFNRTPRSADEFIQKRAAIWLIHTNSTCWEIYAREARLLQLVRDHLLGSAARAYPAQSEDRGAAFGGAGLRKVWRALQGHLE